MRNADEIRKKSNEYLNIDTMLTAIKDSEFLKEYLDIETPFNNYVREMLKRKSPLWAWKNCFAILKRYNSFTPVIPRATEAEEIHARGGGYFLSWDGKGIAIDPGFDYLKNLAKIGLSAGNIDAIILTHGHNDHYSSIDPILALIYELNSLCNKKHLGAINYKKQKWNLALEQFKAGLEIDPEDEICKDGYDGCLAHLEMIDKPTNLSIIDRTISKYPNEIDDDIKLSQRKIDLFLGRSAEKTITSITPLPMDQIRNVYLLNPNRIDTYEEYKIKIKAVPAKHWDFYSKSHSLGLNLDLLDDNKQSVLCVGITGDTGYYFRNDQIDNQILLRELYQEYLYCDLLVAHIGSIRKKELVWLQNKKKHSDEGLKANLYPMHLGILGLLRLLEKLKKSRVKMVVIGEYGEEMKKMRKPLTDLLNSSNAFKNNFPIRSGDIGLVIKLEKDLKVLVESYHNSTPKKMYQDEKEPDRVTENDNTGPITYS